MKVEEIAKIDKKSRRIAIGDIHGCVKTLISLIENQVKPTLNDQLFFLGDYLHRGPDSAGVLDYIMNLIEKGFQVYPLRGNHEQMVMEKDAQIREKISHQIPLPTYDNVPRLLKKSNILDDDGMILPLYRDFLENLPYCYETEDCYFVHAGLNLKASNPMEDFEAMLWQRENSFFPFLRPNKRVIHGHTVMFWEEIQEKVLKKADFIGLDNGCYYGTKNNSSIYLGHYANLCALDVDNWILYVQDCIDKVD